MYILYIKVIYLSICQVILRMRIQILLTIDANKTHWKKSSWDLPRIATCYLEQILKAKLTKQYLYGHLPLILPRRTRHARHGSRINDERIRDVFLWTPQVDVLVLADQQRLWSVLSGYKMPLWRPARSDGCKGWTAIGSQKTQCCQRELMMTTMMMMMMMMINKTS